MKNQMKHYDLVIIGGGIAGLSCAALMADLGLKIGIIEPYPAPALKTLKPSGRTAALLNGSIDVLRKAGLTDDFISSYGAPLRAMKIMDHSISGAQLRQSTFHASEIGKNHYGYNIPNGALRSALYELVQDHDQITLFEGQMLDSYDVNSGRVSICLQDGMTITAELIVGADGKNSKLRELADISCWRKSYQQSALTFLVSHEQSHDDVAVEFHKPGGPLALVPLQGKTSSVVWVEKTERANDLLQLKKQDLMSVFSSLTQDHLGAVELESAVESWSLETLKAERLTDQNMALVAEAAHVMSPVTAQGLNLSLRDIASLCSIISQGAKAGLSLADPTLLTQYEKERRSDIGLRVRGVDIMMNLVSNDKLPFMKMRRAGFQILDLCAPVKRLAIEQGLNPQIAKN